MKLRIYLCVVVLAICFFGCHKEPVAREHVLSDLDQNGFIQSGWMVSIHDGDVDQWTSAVFADANFRADEKLRAAFPENVVHPITVKIVPELPGYEILVLSRIRLSDEQNERVGKIAQAAVDEAHEAWLLKHPDQK